MQRISLIRVTFDFMLNALSSRASANLTPLVPSLAFRMPSFN